MTQETQTGTLEELNVKPGDVVECVTNGFEPSEVGGILTIDKRGYAVNETINAYVPSCDVEVGRTYRLISRDTPPTWGDMTDAEKGALLLAELDGECLEQKGRVIVNGESLFRWAPKQEGCWLDKFAYRIKPEPLVETVTLYGSYNGGQWVFSPFNDGIHSVVQTFTTTNGEPDLDSIKMERIND